MIELYDNDTGTALGEISEGQLQFLIDQLEETSTADQDYYIDRRTIDMIKAVALDYAAVLELLERALGDREGVDIVWSPM